MNRIVYPHTLQTRSLDQLLNRAFGEAAAGLPERSFREVWDESPEAITLRVDLPGFRRDQIQIALTDRKLAVTAESPADQTFGGRYQRVWSLGRELDTSRIAARLDLGVLELTFPKAQPETQESRTIPIQ
jgi:HSP20 family molecular chaperone IbpA